MFATSAYCVVVVVVVELFEVEAAAATAATATAAATMPAVMPPAAAPVAAPAPPAAPLAGACASALPAKNTEVITMASVFFIFISSYKNPASDNGHALPECGAGLPACKSIGLLLRIFDKSQETSRDK